MAIGSSKIGLLGGLVSGGSETFNTSGTFIVPPGVRSVSITGVGAAGNPGNPGNSGTTGNPGSGAGGGAGGGASGIRIWTPYVIYCCNPLYNRGGFAWTQDAMTSSSWPPITRISEGNYRGPGQAGQVGNAGSAGNAGNPGNTGQASSGLAVTFPGGAGGAAGNAGNAGTGGTGGSAGAAGNDAAIYGGNCTLNVPWPGTFPANDFAPVGNGGSGGNSGGTGGRGTFRSFFQGKIGGAGGGGAGVNSAGNPAMWDLYEHRNCCAPTNPNRGFINPGCLPNTFEPAPSKVRGLAFGGGGAGNEVRFQNNPTPGAPTSRRWFLGYGGRGLSSFNSTSNLFSRLFRNEGRPNPPFPNPSTPVQPVPGAPLGKIFVPQCAMLASGVFPQPNTFPSRPFLVSTQNVPTCTIGNAASMSVCYNPTNVCQMAYTTMRWKGQDNPGTFIGPGWIAPNSGASWRAGGGGGFGQALRQLGTTGTFPRPPSCPGFPGTWSAGQMNPGCRHAAGGGGGGGGRGNLFNPAGTGGAGGTGSAASPSTTNCVPVVPGSSYPISVGAPGGQIVISWNPQ